MNSSKKVQLHASAIDSCDVDERHYSAGVGVLAVLVSYNTRSLTVKAIESVLRQSMSLQLTLVVVDNASTDSSAEAIAETYPDVLLIRSSENLGFARAVNLAVSQFRSSWILLVNPDTSLHDGALAALLAFGERHSDHDIFGGRTYHPDGSLNPDSCHGRITPWSAFCMAIGATRAFRGSSWFDSEGMGGWQRDCVREVDIVVGCFCLIRRPIWNALGGFDERYWLYGEDADFCLRVKATTGRRPMFTPDAGATHIGGAARDSATRQVILLAKGRMTVMRSHWPVFWRPLSRPLGLLWIVTRLLGEMASHAWNAVRGDVSVRPVMWIDVWRARRDWLSGY